MGDYNDYGDILAPDTREYEDLLCDEVEGNSDYGNNAQHRFYPICLGELLNKHYRVEHRLGRGGSSTVWMAYDLKSEKYVALKVMIEEHGEYEYHMQKVICDTVKDTSHLLTYIDAFILSGDGKNHRVLVFPLLGPCHAWYNVKEKSMATRMSAARQLLQALESLHDSDIVHQDLNAGNCMWGMTSLDHLGRNAIYKLLGRPQKAVIAIDDGEIWKPGELVKSVEIPPSLRTDAFYLGDFGLAMKLGAPAVEGQPPRPNGRPPARYCSPDRLFNKSPSKACDMWSYMCLFAELYCGQPLFIPLDGGVVSSMVDRLGPLPEEYKSHFCDPMNERDEWFTKIPNPEDGIAAKVRRLAPNASTQELKHVLSIMRKCFDYNPDKRPTATQLLRDPSFQAIMDIHC
ncbi:hypothetical protein PRK78_002998 [Emydomyces testavorans]|uniref:Protein kinase domain-containing protein n=1 Tax=Emydomyces testavorans TaxID=2070801 RepID=A0AAF0DHD1_9EURO|nr:hypothetical protein PRK78_002998 [Emydomyces testavorans]